MKLFNHILFISAAAMLAAVSAQAVQTEAKVKEWTLMVFLNGDNNLDSYGSTDMDEMATVGSTDKVNVVVLRDVNDQSTSSKIYYIEKNKKSVVKDFGRNIDMGDWHNLVDFFKYVKDNYPAQKYAVDIWNHGAGWKKRAPEPLTRGISYDDGSGNHITTPQLGQAFHEMAALNGGKQIDILGMDACLMEMAEVIYEVKDTVKVVAGSEETEPGAGWAYQLFLAQLVANPTASAEAVATMIEQTYAASYSNGVQGNEAVQGSAVSTAKLAAAIGKLNDLLAYTFSILPTVQGGLKTAMSQAQSYYYSDYKDMIHFLQLVKGQVADQHFKQLVDAVVADFRGAVVYNVATGSKLANSNGFSVWVPSDSDYSPKAQAYRELAWTKDTHWAELIEKMLYPTVPVVTIENAQAFDENNDGFVMAGERVDFRVVLKNESPVAAKQAVLRLVDVQGAEVLTGTVNVAEIGKGLKVVDGLSVRLPKDLPAGSYGFKFVLDMPGFGQVAGEFPLVVDGNYTIENYAVSSPHNYPDSIDQTWTISKPGVKGMRIHFAQLATEKRYDYVSIYDANDRLISKMDGKVGAFWTPFIEGDTVKVQLTSDSSVNEYGFDIDKIAY